VIKNVISHGGGHCLPYIHILKPHIHIYIYMHIYSHIYVYIYNTFERDRKCDGDSRIASSRSLAQVRPAASAQYYYRLHRHTYMHINIYVCMYVCMQLYYYILVFDAYYYITIDYYCETVEKQETDPQLF
jgi:hypothetical protein